MDDDEIKINFDPNSIWVNHDETHGYIFNSLNEKLSPLFDNQHIITGKLELINDSFINPSVIYQDSLSNSWMPVMDTIQSLNLNLKNVGEITLVGNYGDNKPTYDFLAEPIISSLSSLADNIQISQDILLGYLPKINGSLIVGTEIKLDLGNSIFGQASNFISLGEIALETLTSELIIARQDNQEYEISALNDKVTDLELKIVDLDEKKNNHRLSDITEDVCAKLDLVDSGTSKCFKGAISTLISESEDYVGQVAESLTRVIEDLPLLLAGKMDFISKKKEEQIVEALIMYANKFIDNKEHHLIQQQKGFYEIFSKIRHRKNKIYDLYSGNTKSFYGLVVMLESYIYILISLKDGK